MTFPQTVYIRFTKFEKGLQLEKAGLHYGDWFIARLSKLSRHLSHRQFICADRFTVADIAVTYALFLARMIGLEGRLTEPLLAYCDLMTARPAFARAREREGSIATG